MQHRAFAVTASVLLAAASGAAMADGQLRISDAPAGSRFNGSSGGAFIVNRIDGDIGYPNGQGLPNGQFYTFCVERSAPLDFNKTYIGQISTSSTQASSTNPLLTPVVTPLSNITAKLYREFASGGTFGRVGSFAAGYTTAAQTDAIQNAIWAAQGQVTVSSLTGDSLALYNWAKANADGLKGVRILRLWGCNGGGIYCEPGQDQLTMIPLPPAGLAGLGTLGCLLGARHLRRRKLAAAE
ncbi:MAG: hypothetical protein WCK33_03360 [Phycisphaerae bacterium]